MDFVTEVAAGYSEMDSDQWLVIEGISGGGIAEFHCEPIRLPVSEASIPEIIRRWSLIEADAYKLRLEWAKEPMMRLLAQPRGLSLPKLRIHLVSADQAADAVERALRQSTVVEIPIATTDEELAAVAILSKFLNQKRDAVETTLRLGRHTNPECFSEAASEILAIDRSQRSRIDPQSWGHHPEAVA